MRSRLTRASTPGTCPLRMLPLNPGDHGGLSFGRPGVSLRPVPAWTCVRPEKRVEVTILSAFAPTCFRNKARSPDGFTLQVTPGDS